MLRNKPLKPGQTISIPCRIQPGPFSDEHLVTIEIETGVLTGFAKDDDVERTPKSEKGIIRGVVLEVKGQTVKVRIFGSFFTTAVGTAFFSSDWVNTHLLAR